MIRDRQECLPPVPVAGRRSDDVRLGAAALCGVIGLLVLIGWACGIVEFTQILPGLTAMNPMTAVALCAAGAALASRGPGSQITVWSLSAILLSIGLAKLLYLSGMAIIPIDELLFASKLDDAVQVPPNRMAPNTALSLVIAALAIATSRTSVRRAVLVSQGLACLLIAVTLFALIGYALGIVALYGMKAFNPMAVHTACALMSVAAGVLCTNPHTGLMRVITDRGPAGQLSRIVLPLVVLVPVVVGLLRLEGQKLGYYDTGTGVALQVFANVLVTFSLMMIGIVLLYRSDLARRCRELIVSRSEAEFQLAEEVARVGHWRVDVGTNELHCSRELVRICGLPSDARPSRRAILALHHPDDATRQRKCSDRALTDGAGWDEYRRIMRPDGEVRMIRSHGTAEKDDHGNVVSLFGVFVDVTELETSRQAAEAATAVKADFLANMSHEIRTPLNAIIGFTDLILDDVGLSEVHRRQLRLVKNSGDALLTVVNDILDFSKMEAGKIELSTRPFDLDHLARGSISIIRQSAELKGLALTVHTTSNLSPYYIGDDSRIRQVLLNLLSNAIKFTQIGSVTLTIDRALDSEGHLVTFVVADTGIGIAPNEEPRLFAQFSQANSSISREHGGTGLGLAISKKLVEAMGGSIGFRRRVCGGSEFSFSIPLQVSENAKALDKRVPSRKAHSQRILVVEDVPANQELVTAMLHRGDHEVWIASNGREALAVVQEQDFDIILMDIQMPVMDGMTATKLIRLLPGNARQIPIIALTANILPDQIAAFRGAGMNDHVGKPINLVELNEVIARHSPSGRRSRSQSAKSKTLSIPMFDEKIFRDLAVMLSADRLEVHSQTFQDAMTKLVQVELGRSVMQDLAHTMVSQAGMFGFLRLSALCRELDEALVAGCPAEDLMSAIQGAVVFALSTLRHLVKNHRKSMIV